LDYTLDYSDGKTFGIDNKYIQRFTRLGTLFVLILVFITLPNGSTTDQLAFIFVNLSGQANTFLGLHFNAKSHKETFEEAREILVEYRTQVYGYVVRHFKHLKD
jgi:hypothetical protein